MDKRKRKTNKDLLIEIIDRLSAVETETENNTDLIKNTKESFEKEMEKFDIKLSNHAGSHRVDRIIKTLLIITQMALLAVLGVIQFSLK